MHYAGQHCTVIQLVLWDLFVIDEAHKLRNAYRPSNVIGRNIRQATSECNKLLLTATPMQNSLLELYGLSTLIDEQLFGDPASFRAQFINAGGDHGELRERLRHFSWRTLRSQVGEYVKYTNRKAITRPFTPTLAERELYDEVSEYLMSDNRYALPAGQRHLLILLIRKVLASSPKALAGTMAILLKGQLKSRNRRNIPCNR